MLESIILKSEYSDGRKVCREIVCDVQSISQKEYFAASEQGLKPEYKLNIWTADYQGEMIVIFRNETYKVYRTFRKSADKMEIYITRKAGKA